MRSQTQNNLLVNVLNMENEVDLIYSYVNSIYLSKLTNVVASVGQN